jgi:polyisoprenoid-binding protein YceI
MRRLSRLFLIPLAILAWPLVSIAAVSAATGAASGQPFTVAHSRITVAGTSNLHDWTVSAEGMRAAVNLPAGFLDGQPTAAATGSFSLAATALRSEKERMNRLMWEALRAAQHPDLVFDLRSARVKSSAAGAVELEAEGVLTVAGVARPTTLALRVQRQGERLFVKGELPLLMSDFGISPPTALLGALKTGNRVVVAIEATLVPNGG